MVSYIKIVKNISGNSICNTLTDERLLLLSCAVGRTRLALGTGHVLSVIELLLQTWGSAGSRYLRDAVHSPCCIARPGHNIAASRSSCVVSLEQRQVT